MKISNKIIALSLICVICAFSAIQLIGCETDSDSMETTISNQEAITENNASGDIDAKILPDLPDADFEGYTFTFFTFMGDSTLMDFASEIPRELVAETENGDLINDAVYKRNLSVMEKYNIKFDVVPVEYNDTPNALIKAIGAGDDIYDMALLSTGLTPSIVPKGVLLQTELLPYIDENQPW